MADTKIIGTMRVFGAWGLDGLFGGPSPDWGNICMGGAPTWVPYDYLDSEGKPQLVPAGTAGGKPILSTGAGEFAKWYRDTIAASVTENVEFILTESNGIYTRAHTLIPNNPFTLYSFESKAHAFQYKLNQYIKIYISGWQFAYVYIAGKRLPQIWGDVDNWVTFSLNGLGLTPDEYYPIKFFMSNNKDGWSNVGIETNFALEEEYMVALSQWIIGSGTITPAAGTYSPGAQIITATPSAGHEVASLTINGTAITSGDTVDVSTHSTIAAVFSHVARNTRVCTRDQIIAAALRKCQVLAEAELPTADQIAVGAEALERFMKHMQTDTEFRWLFVQRTQAIAADEQEVVLTNSADILDIYNLFLRDATNQDIPLRLVDAHWYDSTLQFKSTSDALPAVALAKFWRDPATNIAQVNLSIYPKPAQAYTLYYRVMAKYYNLYTGTDELLQDEIWCDVVVYGLAARLADEYNRTDRAVYLEQKFEKLKDAAKRKSSSTRDSLTVFPV